MNPENETTKSEVNFIKFKFNQFIFNYNFRN